MRYMFSFYHQLHERNAEDFILHLVAFRSKFLLNIGVEQTQK
jgi:hypothetical protein